jgi:hypothetical protein
MAEVNRSRHKSTDHTFGALVASGAAGALIDVLPYLGRKLGLQGLACLASSSRQLRQECVDLAKRDAHALLFKAVPPVKPSETLAESAEAAAAAVPPPSLADQRLQPVLWLAHVAPSVATSVLEAEDVLRRLVHLPHVPVQQAQQLVAAGVRMPYAQLLAAARSMVAGAEVWVQAQQQLGVASDVPAAALEICCGQDWVSSQGWEKQLSYCALRTQLLLSWHDCSQCTSSS